MTYEFHLRRPATNFSWRPSFVRNTANFTNTIKNYREKFAKAPEGSANERQVVANFNKAYSAWIAKVKNENSKRRAKESEFFKNLVAARKSGNAAAINVVMAKYSNGKASSARRASPSPRRAGSASVARSPSPKRSGKKRNTSNLRKMLAHNKLSQTKANLMAQKAALESERNKLEVKIFALIRKLGELPY
jgi:hypothetical protein